MRPINASRIIPCVITLLLVCMTMSAAAQQPPPPPQPPPDIDIAYGSGITGTLTAGQRAEYRFYGAVGDYVRIALFCACEDSGAPAVPVVELVLASGTILAEALPDNPAVSRNVTITGTTHFGSQLWLELPESGIHTIRLRIETVKPEGQAYRLELYGVYGQSGEWRTSPPSIDYARNILWNPGAEDAPIQGQIQGWQTISGRWDAPFDRDGARTGISYFTPIDGSTTEMVQDIDVSIFSERIDQERAYFYFTASFRSGTATTSETPDAVRVIVDYRAERNSPNTLANFDTGGINNARDWRAVVNILVPPPGTRWMRVRLLTTRLGARHDARFDALALIPANPDVLEVERWQDGMTLVGYDKPYTTSDNRTALPLYWMTTAPLRRVNWNMTLEVYNSQDVLLGRVGYNLRFRDWLPGRLLLTEHLLNADLSQPGIYRIRIIWTDAENGGALPMRDGRDESNFFYTVPDPNLTPTSAPED